jgi:hypothetical protein
VAEADANPQGRNMLLLIEYARCDVQSRYRVAGSMRRAHV